MKKIDIKDIEVREIAGGPLFTGGKVYTQYVLDEEYGAQTIQIVNVQFEPGARNKFQKFDMGFFGEKCIYPIDFLDRMTDFRHRLVHSSGRVDKALIDKYLKGTLRLGDLLELPFGLPNTIHMFFVFLTKFIDELFAVKFNWTRSLVAPEELTD